MTQPPENKAFSSPMRRSERLFGFIYLPVHVFVLPIILGLLIPLIAPDADESLVAARMNLIYYAISAVFLFAVLFRFLKQSFSDMLDNRLRSFQAVALGYFLTFTGSFLVSSVLYLLIDEPVNPNNAEIIRLASLNSGTVIVSAVLLGPIVEETLFRGVLFGTLRKKNRLLAYAVTAGVFAVYHIWQYFFVGFDWNLFLYMLQYIPSALVLCWAYEYSGSIWPPIVLHALVNYLQIRLLII